MRSPALLLVSVLLLVACGEAGERQPGADLTTEDPESLEEPRGPLRQDSWRGLPDAPTALGEVAVASFGGQVWTAGGFTEDGQATPAVQILDPTFETWETGPELPEAVHHAALVSTGEALYLIGGYVGSGFAAPTAAVRRLDPASGQWVEGTPLPTARAAGAAAWDGDRILYGGGVGTGGLAGDVLAFDGAEWSPVGVLSEPREHLAAASDGQGLVWFLGGRTGGLDTNLATVDVVRGSDVTAAGEIRRARGGVAAFWSPAHGACLVGGEEPAGTFDDVECIDSRGELSALPPLNEARHGLGAAVVDGVAYVVLGGPEPGLSVSAVAEALPVGAPRE